MPWFPKTPKLAPLLLPKRIWKKDTPQVYLTFDDGPVPGVTDFVLNELAKRGQKATFFVVGDNVLTKIITSVLAMRKIDCCHYPRITVSCSSDFEQEICDI